MPTKQSNLSWVAVSDFKKAKKFFTETLGLKINSLSEEFNWAEVVGKDGGALIGIAGMGDQESCGGIKPGQNAVVTLDVANIEESKALLEERGVQFFGEIMEVPGHVKLALFADPDGNKFQLVQNCE